MSHAVTQGLMHSTLRCSRGSFILIQGPLAEMMAVIDATKPSWDKRHKGRGHETLEAPCCFVRLKRKVKRRQ